MKRMILSPQRKFGMTLVPRRDYRNVILFETSQDNLNDLILAEINLEGGLLTFQSAQRCDFTNANLRWTHWRQADLSGSTLNGADMTDSNLVFAKLRNIHASNAILNEVFGAAADFSDSIMISVKMNHCELAHCNFTGCDLSKSEIKHTNIHSAKFRSTNLQEINFSYSWFNTVHPRERQNVEFAIFQKTDISKSIFYRADLRGLDLTDTIHEQTDFKNAFYDISTKWPNEVKPENEGAILLYPRMNLLGMNLNDIHLCGVTLSRVNASNISLHGAYLWYSDFSYGNLTQADLSSCFLLDSTFENAILSEASFLNAKIARCNFINADLRGADMRFDIKHFHSCTDEKHEFTLKNAKHDRTTIWPDGFDPKEWDR